MRGLVCDIQHFCVHDGPGIRTTAFLQGCTLRCAWCHNPECIPDKPQLRYRENQCIRCGACEAVCPEGVHRVWLEGHTLNRALCTACGKCVSACPAGALNLSAKEMTAESTAQELLEDLPYYRTSGGGITLSGGEPLKQSAFSLEVLRLCREGGAHTCLETALQVPESTLKASLPLVDLYLADFKMDNGLFDWTGGNAGLIKKNLALLHGGGANIILRCPIIPVINDGDGHIAAIAETVRLFPRILRVELMAYHKLGTGKYAEIGQEYPLQDTLPMSRDEKESFLRRVQNAVSGKVIWG